MIDQIIKDYRILAEIGKGGMATVYLAEHQLLHSKVAVKVLNKELYSDQNIRKRFLAEARNMARISHPGIIRVTDLIEEQGMVAFVMEYVDGQTLKEYLEQYTGYESRNGFGPGMDEARIRDYFSQMLDAVNHVHYQNLVHRDIKPSNFMISKEGVVKLMDFGIAKITDPSSAEFTHTATSQQLGTPMYMSPEQIRSSREVTPASDIYSLGVVLWQIVTGRKPYDAQTLSLWEIQTKIVTEPLENTGSVFQPIIEKATRKEPGERYRDCRELKEAFLAAAGSTGQPAARNAGDRTIVERITVPASAGSPQRPHPAVPKPLPFSGQQENPLSQNTLFFKPLFWGLSGCFLLFVSTFTPFMRRSRQSYMVDMEGFFLPVVLLVTLLFILNTLMTKRWLNILSLVINGLVVVWYLLGLIIGNIIQEAENYLLGFWCFYFGPMLTLTGFIMKEKIFRRQIAALKK